MSVTVVGSVALDTVEAPAGMNVEGLGGSATYFALAAANYGLVRLVGVVGDDFPPEHTALLESKGIGLEGLERAPGKTFRWSGRYHKDLNTRDTLDTQLNVFEHFHPKLPPAAGESPYLFLGNIHPSLQAEVFEQARPKFVGMDTMNLWIAAALGDLKQVLKRVDALFLNDSEAFELTGRRNLVQAAEVIFEMGPPIVVIKKGEHGCLLFQGTRVFSAPGLPLREVVDPTGAGDAFAGGFMGYIAREDKTDFPSLKRAVIHGSVVASFTCEAFGPDRLGAITPQEIETRYRQFVELASF